MARLKAFEAAHPSRPGPACALCKVPDPLKVAVKKGRMSGSTYRTLAAFVTAEGHKVTPYQVSYHLREHGQG